MSEIRPDVGRRLVVCDVCLTYADHDREDPEANGVGRRPDHGDVAPRDAGWARRP